MLEPNHAMTAIKMSPMQCHIQSRCLKIQMFCAKAVLSMGGRGSPGWLVGKMKGGKCLTALSEGPGAEQAPAVSALICWGGRVSMLAYATHHSHCSGGVTPLILTVLTPSSQVTELTHRRGYGTCPALPSS